PHLGRHGLRGPRTARLRARRRPRAHARDLRQATLSSASDCVHDRRDGDRPRSGTRAHAARGARMGERRTRGAEALLDGQALCHLHAPARDRSGAADSWGNRLLGAAPHRTHLTGCAGTAFRGRHQRDPENGDRARDILAQARRRRRLNTRPRMKHADKIALITGGTRGIGRTLALTLAREGATLVLNYKQNESAARETLGAIEALGAGASLIKADLEDPAQIDALFEEVKRRHGRLDYFVSNAAASAFKRILYLNARNLDRTFALNVRAFVLGAIRAVP